ncbi:hypothetical protein ABH931_000430 [Streptacidiphilus sp. MAP12-33]|uniref:LamG domain-containing protein n=1 Tax=Streptacidiphilus sp. MAP12-33 TaxID=3156266 RepID=UPI0035164032
MTDRPVSSAGGQEPQPGAQPSAHDAPTQRVGQVSPQPQQPPQAPAGFGPPGSGYGYPPPASAQQPSAQQPSAQQPSGQPSFAQQPTVPQQSAAWQQQQQQPQQPWSAMGPTGPTGTIRGVEPDWTMLADQHENGQRRKRKLAIGGGIVAVLAVAGTVGALLVTGHHDSTRAGGGPTPTVSHSGSAQPSGGPSSARPAPAPDPGTYGSISPSRGTLALGVGKDAKQGKAPGRSVDALLLPSGQDSFASTTGPVVATGAGFTISAQARSDQPTGVRTVLSQGAADFYSFTLGRTTAGADNRWVFKVQVPGGGSVAVQSKGSAATNQWTLLTAVYDSGKKEIALYVNGALQGTAKVTGIRQTQGGLQVGRVRSNSQWVSPWHGAVAGIQVWNHALSAADVVKVAAGPSAEPRPDYAWLLG